ncbi:MAG: rhodanese-like domain-containing protein [Micrococcales bacterium]
MKTTALVGVVLAITLGLVGCTVIHKNVEHVDMAKVGQIIDLRSDDAWVLGHLQGAKNYDSAGAEFQAAIRLIPRDQIIVLYGKDANQVETVIVNLVQRGYTRLINAGSLEQAASATGLEVVF